MGISRVWIDRISNSFNSYYCLLESSSWNRYICLYASSFDWNNLCWWSCHPFMWIGSSDPYFIWPKIILRLLFGDVNPGDVARSVDNGTWKKNYNSKYESVLAFLLLDPIGQLARDVSYGGSFLSYVGHYSDKIPHDFIENSWITSRFDHRLQMRVLRHKGGYLLQHRYLSDEEVARVQKDILLEREEEK